MARSDKILTEKQKQLLTLLSQVQDIVNNFYLSGGTALAEYYLRHRYSEDLDFFSSEEFDPMAVQVILKKITEQSRIKFIDYQKSFNRNLFFLHFHDEVIKTEFTYYPFSQIEKPLIVDNLKIDSLIDIATNKVFTIYQNPRSRDFIDLYCILIKQKWDFSDLRKKARIKFDTHIDPLQLAQQLLQVTELQDYPRMVIDLRVEEWQNYWMKEVKRLKEEVLE